MLISTIQQRSYGVASSETEEGNMNKVTPADIAKLMERVEVHTTTCQEPTPHVMAIAWLDGKFHLGTAMSKSVDPANFDEALGIKYSTADALKLAEEKLWEGEGYALYKLLTAEVIQTITD